MDECGHTRLHLMSGGYYLGCIDCGKKWVAITNDGNDRSADHAPRYGASIQPYFEYLLTPIPQVSDHRSAVSEDTSG